MKWVGLLSIVLSGPMALAAIENFEFPAGQLDEIHITNPNGDVTISKASGSVASVEANKVKSDHTCRVNASMSDDQEDLYIVVEQGSFFKKDGCEIHLTIQVPDGVEIEHKSGSGDLVISGLASSVEFELGSGDAFIDGRVIDLEGRTGSGSVKAIGLVGDAEVKTGSGDVRLSYERVPRHAELEIKTGSGDATVLLPSSAKILSRIKAGSGQVVNEIGSEPGAPVRVSMQSGSGDIRIKRR